MKKVLYIILSVFIIFACIVACDDNASKSKITPVTPIGPEEPEPEIVTNYITFKSSAPFSIVPSYSTEGGCHSEWNGQLFYSTNTNDWIEFSKNTVTTAISALSEGSHYLYFRGLGNTRIIYGDSQWILEATSDVSLSGNIMNLLDYEKVQQNLDISMVGSCFDSMFENWTTLTDVSELSLPSLSLSTCCYCEMFKGTGITTAPKLPATTLKELCYCGMFENCISLSGKIVLPATTLAEECYYYMFEGCTALEECEIKANSFAIDVVGRGCCEDMFYGCTSLTSLIVSFTNWGTSNTNTDQATEDWVHGVAPSGTFTCPGTLPLTTGTSNIPEGWTVVNGVSVTGVSLDTTSTTLSVGGNVTLNATILPSNAENKNVTWSSNNTSVATVSNGVVTGVGAGSATITVKTVDGSKTATCTVTVTQLITTGYASATNRSDVMWVQLWAGGPKWATVNVGSTATDYVNATTYTNDIVGGYYNWGKDFDRRTSPSDGAYCSSTTDIQKSDYDTAKNLWGDNWQMPTKADLEALVSDTNCTWTWCTGTDINNRYTTDCTLNGYKVSGKAGTAYANNSIFLPASGYYDMDIYKLYDNGYFWSSTPDSDDTKAIRIAFGDSYKIVKKDYREDGFSIRAVLTEN